MRHLAASPWGRKFQIRVSETESSIHIHKMPARSLPWNCSRATRRFQSESGTHCRVIGSHTVELPYLLLRWNRHFRCAVVCTHEHSLRAIKQFVIQIQTMNWNRTTWMIRHHPLEVIRTWMFHDLTRAWTHHSSCQPLSWRTMRSRQTTQRPKMRSLKMIFAWS